MTKPKANDVWQVQPHGPIERLTPNLWRIEGEVQGSPLRRVMSVARRADGSLVVHNAVPLRDEAMAELDAWGEVRCIVVPNGWHRLDAPVYQARYPKARVFCPAGARAKVEEVLPVHGAYEDFDPDASISFETLEGTGGAEGVMIVRSGDHVALVLNDAVFNLPHQGGLMGFALRYVTASTGGPRVSRVFRWAVLRDRRAFAAHLTRLAGISGISHVVVSHHQTIDVDPSGTLARVAASL